MTSQQKTVVVEIDAPPITLEPSRAFDQVALCLAPLLTAPLFETTELSGVYAPCSVAEWSSDDGGTTWRILLIDELYRANGNRLLAEDYVAGLRNALTPPKIVPMAWIADLVDGARDLREGRIEPSMFTGFRAVGPKELVIRFCTPIAAPEALLAAPLFSPSAECLRTTDMSGVGPYQLSTILPDDRGLILEANPLSHRQSKNAPRQLVFLRTTEPMQGLRLFDQGLIDVTCGTTFPPESKNNYSESPEFIQRRLTMVAHLSFEMTRCPAFRSIEIRKAISTAIDRAAISEILDGMVDPLWHYRDLWNSQQSLIPARDSLLAQQIVRAADVELPRAFRIAYADFPPNGQVVKLIAENLLSSLAIKIKPVPLPYNEYIRAVRSGMYEALYTLNPAPFGNVLSLLLPFGNGGELSSNYAAVDSELDDLIVKALANSCPNARRDMENSANERFLESLPVIPLLGGRSVLLRNSRLKGFELHANGFVPFERLTLE